MDVVWQLAPGSNGVGLMVVHDWGGPAWRLIGGLAADLAVGIALRTLAGIQRRAKRGS